MPRCALGLLSSTCRYMPLLDIIRAANITHAIILGNHDDEGLLSREAIIELDAKQPGSATRTPADARLGVHTVGRAEAGNYWIDIAPPGGGGPATLRLWFLHSGSRGCGGVPGWCDRLHSTCV